MFKNLFSFNGRIRRLEYGLSYLIFIAVFLGCGLISGSITDSADEGWGANAFFLIPLVPAVWFILMPFYHLWMLFADGDIGDNEYRENPKG